MKKRVLFFASLFLVAGLSFGYFYFSQGNEVLLGPCEGDFCVANYYLDVGAPGDDDESADFYVDPSGWSERLFDEGVNYREISELGSGRFFLNVSELTLNAQGVPEGNALIEVGYKDVVDYGDCPYQHSYIHYCKPRIYTFLEFGNVDSLALQSFGGFADNSWKGKQIFLEGSPWLPLQASGDLIEFSIYYPGQEGVISSVPIDYINVTFLDEATFNNLREQDRASRYLTRVDYLESESLSGDDYDSAFVVYSKNYLERIFPNSVPLDDEISSEISAFEVSGFKEPVTFAVYAFENVSGVMVNVSDLTYGGNIIPSENISVQKVVYQDLRWRGGYSEHYGVNPSYLEGFDSVNVSEDTSQQFWLTVSVPDDLPGGVYEGEINISTAFNGSQLLNLKFEVFDVELKESDAEQFMFGSPFSSGFFYSDPVTIAFENILDHDSFPKLDFSGYVSDIDSLEPDFTTDAETFDVLQAYGSLPEKPRIFVYNYGWQYIWREVYGNSDYFQQDSSIFDDKYLIVLGKYREFFDQYGVDPVLSFYDEPCSDETKRRETAHMNRLAKEAGFETWVTYYPSCEIPFAGHTFEFNDLSDPSISGGVPDWVGNDESLVAHWSFEEGFEDVSGNENHALGYGDAFVQDGHLVLDGDGDYLQGDYSQSFNMSNITFLAWTRLENSDPDDENYLFSMRYDFYYRFNGGTYDTIWTDKLDPQSFYNSPSVFTHFNWSHAGFVFDGRTKRIYRNGFLYGSQEASGNLSRDSFPYFIIGDNPTHSNTQPWHGKIDEVLLFNRSLSQQEIEDIVASSADFSYQYINLSVEFLDESVPENISFVLNDSLTEVAPAFKELFVNGERVWYSRDVVETNQLFEISIGDFLEDGQNDVTFSFSNNLSRRSEAHLYFPDDFWRSLNWDVESNSDSWSYSYKADELGDLGPMSPFLDYKVYFVSLINPEEVERSIRYGDVPEYYTTYYATQPVIGYNRFLNGLYASAIDAKGVYTYTYGSAPQPYDDMFGSWIYREDSPGGLRGQNNYQLAMPVWDGGVRNTLPFEALREGVEDSKIIFELERLIQEKPGPLAEEARDYLEGIFDNVSRPFIDYKGSNELEPIESYANGVPLVIQDLGGRSGNFSVFDDIRYKMLSYIVEIGNGYCGDGDCSGGEDCDNCPVDCNCIPEDDPPEDPDNPGDDSGSPGDDPDDDDGSGDDSICVEDWDCSDWSECVNGTQTKSCDDLNECGTLWDRPDLEQECGSDEFLTGGEEPGEELSGADRFDLYFAGAVAVLGIIGVFTGVVIFFLRERWKKKFSDNVDLKY